MSKHFIDFHHHMLPPVYMQTPEIAEELAYVPSLFKWTPQQSIDIMDANGVSTALLSLRSPGTWFGDRDRAIKLAQQVNDYATDLKVQFGRRFGLFATLPLPDVDGSIAEIARAYDDLKTEGIGLFTCYGEKWLGDPSYDPVFEELNRRHAVVFIHPQPPYKYRWIMHGVPPSAMEYIFDTTRALTSMLYNGIFQRFPNIKFIFTHAGGVLPNTLGRMDRVQGYTPSANANMPDGLYAELAKVYFDCTTSCTPQNFGFVKDLVPPTHLLFGTDSPVVPPQNTIKPLGELGLSEDQIHAITRGNAELLFPHLALPPSNKVAA
jgi:predicted TIM-barrel fold metal-dependent hydrolase